MGTKLLLGLGLLSLVMSLTTMQSCQKQDMSQQIQQVDSLMDKVKEAENTMVIDIEAIKSRYDTMQRMDSFITADYNRKVTNRFSTMMNKYKAIKSNYQNFIKNYKLIKYENKKHRKRLEDLKKDLVDGNLKPEKFESIYKEEKQIINEHLKRTKELVGSITHIEREYRRTQDKVAKTYQQVKETSS